MNREEKATGIRNGIESFGLSWKNQNSKTYLFGTLPIADAFITWANAGIKPSSQGSSPMIAFHLYSVFAVITFLILVFRPWQRFTRHKQK
jgi:hypothetical protein